MINKCPYCNTDLEENTEICPVCNSDLTMLCPYCKQKIRAYDRVCQFCQTDLFRVTDKIIFYTGIGLTALWIMGNLTFLLTGYLAPMLFALKSSDGVYTFDLGTYFRLAFGMLIPVIVPYLILIFKDSREHKSDSILWIITNVLIALVFMVCFYAIRSKGVI